MSEPIKERGERDERQKGDGKFFKTSADTTMAFDEAEEVFDFVPPAIIAAVKGRRAAARCFFGMQTAGALAAQPLTKVVGVKTLVADDTAPSQATEQRRDGAARHALRWPPAWY